MIHSAAAALRSKRPTRPGLEGAVCYWVGRSNVKDEEGRKKAARSKKEVGRKEKEGGRRQKKERRGKRE